METLFECKKWSDLEAHIRKTIPNLTGCIVVSPYCMLPDRRIGWKETYIVGIELTPGGIRQPIGFMDTNGRDEE